jgi:predicted outer membrane repeat protein
MDYKELINFIRDHYRTDEFISLHAPTFKEKDRSYVLDAIDSTFVSSIGEYVNRFERDLAAFTGAAHAIATVNGTTALQTALQLVGVDCGDEVITQPLTFVATANAVAHLCAHPVFVDVDRDTMGLSPEALEAWLEENAEVKDKGKDEDKAKAQVEMKDFHPQPEPQSQPQPESQPESQPEPQSQPQSQPINKNTGRRIAAILPMHTFGHPCRIERIVQIARKWSIPVVEDAAEAIGSYVGNTHCGLFGDVGILSFNGNKTITCGGGGAILTNDASLGARAKHLTTTAKVPHPWEFEHDEIGYNFRMPNLNAALACAQLERLPEILAEKRSLALAYRQFFKDKDWAVFLNEPDGTRSNYWLCAIALSNAGERDTFLGSVNNQNVMVRPVWKLMTELSMFKECSSGPVANAKWLRACVVNLPSGVRKS